MAAALAEPYARPRDFLARMAGLGRPGALVARRDLAHLDGRGGRRGRLGVARGARRGRPRASVYVA